MSSSGSAFGAGVLGVAGREGQCPCGSGTAYAGCCGELHAGTRVATTAEELMRSRYAAFAVADADYLLRTWHPRTRPEQLDIGGTLRWIGLRIVGTHAGGEHDDVGTVEYEATSTAYGRRHVLHELSRFERRGGRWYYVDGDVED